MLCREKEKLMFHFISYRIGLTDLMICPDEENLSIADAIPYDKLYYYTIYYVSLQKTQFKSTKE